MAKVPFNIDNINRCLCTRCPVQAESQCVKEKKEKREQIINSGDIENQSKEVPNLYCSSGIAECKDLDTKQMCICGVCPVWAEYDLPYGKPVNYFCRDGEAE